jgi:alpha-L-fucosidase
VLRLRRRRLRRGGQGYGPTGCGGKLGGPMGTCEPNPAYGAFHNKTFGADFDYSEFGPMFTAELFDPDAWAALFAASGIKYVVLTSKHHEGWTNWCSAEAFGWNACDNGPHRDLVGELSASVRAAGMHMGLYHSIFEFYHPLYLQDKANNFSTSRYALHCRTTLHFPTLFCPVLRSTALPCTNDWELLLLLCRYVDEVYIPQSKELNTRYQPDLIWSDGDWEANSDYWKSTELLAWMYRYIRENGLFPPLFLLEMIILPRQARDKHRESSKQKPCFLRYNEAPNRDTVVVNDRWGAECSLKHGGYFSGE